MIRAPSWANSYKGETSAAPLCSSVLCRHYKPPASSYGAEPSQCHIWTAQGALPRGWGCPAAEPDVLCWPCALFWMAKGLSKRCHREMEQSAQAGTRLHQHCSHPSPPTQSSCRDSTRVEPGAVLVQQRETEPKTLMVTTSALQTQCAQLQICPVANRCRAPARHLRSRQGCCEPCGTPITRERSSSAGDGGKQLLSPLQVTCCLCSSHRSCTKASRGR